jgi:tRNA (guanine37-N1)-methyltransferase
LGSWVSLIVLSFHVVTLFPEMFSAVQDLGITGRAYRDQLWSCQCYNPRDFVHDVHKTIDDRPYGGGPGMVMRYQPLADAVTSMTQALGRKPHLVYLSPQGVPLTQAKVSSLAQMDHLALLCGRYEGVDERFVTSFVDEEISMGDFVVSGGELPAMMLMDAVIRLLPGALGHHASAAEDSFSNGLLDCPHYTRPVDVMGLTVPAVLQSRNHAAIAQWRLKQQLMRTRLRRPDLLQDRSLSVIAQKMLHEIDQEIENSANLSKS